MAHPHAVPVTVGSPVGEALTPRAPGGDLKGSRIPGSALPRCQGPGGIPPSRIQRALIPRSRWDRVCGESRLVPVGVTVPGWCGTHAGQLEGRMARGIEEHAKAMR